VERSRQAIELAERHGWTDESAVGLACVILAAGLAWQGRLEEAENWIQRAERTVRAEAEPAAGLAVIYIRGELELARGRDADALAAFRAAERLAGVLALPHLLLMQVRAWLLHALVRLGDTERAEQALAGLGDQDRDRGEIRIAIAVLRLAQDDPQAAAAVLAPVLEGAAPVTVRTWLAYAFMLEAIVQEALGDPVAAGRAVERALDLAEPDNALLAFLLQPAPGLLERHARDCARHAALIAEILSLPRGVWGGGQPPQNRGGLGGSSPRLVEPLSQSEIRVLRYLPTNLSAREIARELSVSLNTVRTHMRRPAGTDADPCAASRRYRSAASIDPCASSSAATSAASSASAAAASAGNPARIACTVAACPPSCRPGQ
jgi:LuxR family maltose regulon positive regulatory protein